MSKTAKAVRYDEIAGKTVAGAGFGWSNMLIAFTDGTVLALTAQENLEGAEIYFEQGRDVPLESRQWCSEACEAGLITNDECNAAYKKSDERRIAQLERELANLRGEKEQEP